MKITNRAVGTTFIPREPRLHHLLNTHNFPAGHANASIYSEDSMTTIVVVVIKWPKTKIDTAQLLKTNLLGWIFRRQITLIIVVLFYSVPNT